MNLTPKIIIASSCLYLVACGDATIANGSPQDHRVAMSMGTYGGVIVKPKQAREIAVDQHTIIIKGQSYKLDDPRWRNSVINSQFPSLRFGYLKDDATAFHFFQRQESVDVMPSKGTANYAGQAIYLIDGSETPITTDATFTVNFDQKTIAGRIQKPNLQLSAIIDDVLFYSRPSKDREAPIIQGEFCGKNAEAMAGMFRKPHGFSGTFGAVRKPPASQK